MWPDHAPAHGVEELGVEGLGLELAERQQEKKKCSKKVAFFHTKNPLLVEGKLIDFIFILCFDSIEFLIVSNDNTIGSDVW